MAVITIKRGSTFKVKPTSLYQADNTVTPLVGYSISSMVRTVVGDKVAVLSMHIDTVSNVFYSDPVDTSDFPLGDLVCDVRFEKDGDVEYAPNINLLMINTPTR